jgi:hypothetical protein
MASPSVVAAMASPSVVAATAYWSLSAVAEWLWAATVSRLAVTGWLSAATACWSPSVAAV